MPPPQESLATILFRLSAIETEFATFKQQLSAFETTREADLKLERINDTATRMEMELKAIRTSIDELNNQMSAKEGESKERDHETSTAQDKLQIKVLVSILSTIIVIVSGLLVFYITHPH